MVQVIALLLAGDEAPNEEVHLSLETHSDRGMCMGELTINILQILLSQYMHIVMQPLDFQHRSMSMTCINNIMYAAH